MKKKINYDFDKRRAFDFKKYSLCLFRTLQQNPSFANYKQIRKTSKKNSVFFSLKHPKNYCILTGRSKGVFRCGGLARNQLKNLINQGHFYGMRKVSW